MDSATTRRTPAEFEARMTPWVGAYPAQTFDEHAAVAARASSWTLAQWGASRSESGGADFVVQSGLEAYLVNIAQVPRCGCSSHASPCGHVFWVYTRILGLAENDPIVWQTSLTSAELSSILASLLPAPQAAAPPPPPPVPLVERKRPLSATAFADSSIRRAPPTLRDSFPPRLPAPSQIQSQPYPPHLAPPAPVPLASLDLSLVPPSALRGYLDHFLRRQPALLSARALDLYRPRPLEAVSDTGCYNLLLDLVSRDPYVHTTLYDAFARPPPTPVAYPQPAPPAPAEPSYQTSLPTPPPTANPYSEPAETHALSFGKEVNRVRQAVKFTASKRGTQVRKNFDTIAGGVRRSVSATSHPQTKLNAVRSLAQMAQLAVNADGDEIHNKLMDHGGGYQGVYTCIIGIWDALECMTPDGQRRALPEVRKFAHEVLAPYGIDGSINGAIQQIERGEQVCQRRTDR